MYASTVNVYDCDGRPLKGARVVLSFSEGQTTPVYTDSYTGAAQVQHSARGRATVFVNGQERGAGHFPGTCTVSA